MAALHPGRFLVNGMDPELASWLQQAELILANGRERHVPPRQPVDAADIRAAIHRIAPRFRGEKLPPPDLVLPILPSVPLVPLEPRDSLLGAAVKEFRAGGLLSSEWLPSDHTDPTAHTRGTVLAHRLAHAVGWTHW